MSSGKQLSFASGEVSPLERYKSSDITYQNGLNKLRNMYVRRGGGVSNFPGWRQTAMYLPDGSHTSGKYDGLWRVDNGEDSESPSYAYLESWVPFDTERPTVVEVSGLTFVKVKPGKGVFAGENAYRVLIFKGGPNLTDTYLNYRTFPTQEDLDAFDLLQIKVIEEGDYYIISPDFNATIEDSLALVDRRYGIRAIKKDFQSENGINLMRRGATKMVGRPDGPGFGLAIPTLAGRWKATWDANVGLQRDVVRYLVTGEDEDNVEFPITSMQSVYTLENGVPTPNSSNDNILLPYATPTGNLTNSFTFEINSDAAPKAFKKVHLYRANSVKLGETEPLYGLVSSANINVNDSSLTVFSVDASQRDISRTPPLDFSNIPLSDFLGGGIDNQGIKANMVCKYQGRLIAAAIPFKERGVEVKAGEVLVSKLGAPFQFTMPQITRDVEAFRFSVPVKDGSQVVACEDFFRLLLFTEKGVYAAMGGQGGALTPTTSNQTKISSTGCSNIVKPVKLSQTLFYLSHDRAKIMAVGYNEQVGFKVVDISASFQHLFEQEIVDLEAVSQTEDFVFALRADGKIIALSVNINGEVGASLLDLGMRVTYLNAKDLTDTYMPSVTGSVGNVRRQILAFGGVINGSLVSGFLPFRIEGSAETEDFSNNLINFGNYLKNLGRAGFTIATPGASWGSALRPKMACYSNIEAVSPDEWEAGKEMLVNFSNYGGDINPKTYVFFYDRGGVSLRANFYPNDSTYDSATIGGFDFSVKGTFDVDVPEELRNVWEHGFNSDTEDEAKNRVSSRWLPTFDQILGLEDQGNIYNDLVAVCLSALDKPLYRRDSAGGLIFNFESPLQIPVSVVADGKVISSPLNPNIETMYATLNFIASTGDPKKPVIWANLDLENPACLVKIGLPFTSEFETLDIEASDNRTLTSSNKLVNEVGVALYQTKGGKIGTDQSRTLEDFEDIQVNRELDFSGTDKESFTGVRTVNFQASYNDHGRVKIINVDPVPITIISVYPKGVTSGE